MSLRFAKSLLLWDSLPSFTAEEIWEVAVITGFSSPILIPRRRLLNACMISDVRGSKAAYDFSM